VSELQRLEAIVDASGAPQRIEALLPLGVRPRQLCVRTLLIGMLLVAVHGRPAHLRRVHEALLALEEQERWRLGVLARWRSGPHELTYRQVERTFALVARALSKQEPDGRPSELLSEILDALLEASVAVSDGAGSDSLAIDWTDLESFARAPKRDGSCADAEASFGHRRGEGERHEAFFGYYLQAATIVADERGPAVAELVRRMQLASCRHDPPALIVPVLARLAASGVGLSDVLADCGYSYREAQTFALPARALGAKLIVDLHPNDRGRGGTHQGAILANGRLYCPATPESLLELSPLARAATPEQVAAHDSRAQELSRYKLGTVSARDGDGYQRACCPAVRGKVRCPLRASSMTLSHTRPEISAPPAHPPACCQQRTITVPPSVNAKTAQKHDYPSPAHRRSYARRSAAERTFATVSDRASNDLGRGFCRLMGLTPLALFVATAFVARNLRVADAFAARCAEDQRRGARGLARKHRRRRRQTVDDLIGAAAAPP
jgi:hypothetical protein